MAHTTLKNQVNNTIRKLQFKIKKCEGEYTSEPEGRNFDLNQNVRQYYIYLLKNANKNVVKIKSM